VRAAGSRAPEQHGRLVVAAITGLLLKQLADPQPRFETDVLVPQLTALVEGMVR